MLTVGNIIENVKCESFKDNKGKIKVRPLKDEGFPKNINIECSATERKAHPLGTKFYTENVRVCMKPNKTFYLRAAGQKIYKI